MENVTKNGHLIGMLDRDQRTAKVHYCNSLVVFKNPAVEQLCNIGANNKNIVSHHNNSNSKVIPGKASPSNSWRLKSRQNPKVWKSLLRLKHALIVGAYLSLITFPSTSTAPTGRDKMTDRMQEEPKWYHPCGTMNNKSSGSESDGSEVLPIADLLDPIVSQANTAYDKAEKFKDEFVQKRFNTNSDKQLSLSTYPWLPVIPKTLGEPIPEDHKQNLELNTVLLETYGHLQRIAVGLEQIVWDMRDSNDHFVDNFTEAEHQLRLLLCETLIAIIERKLAIPENITRDIMTDEHRKPSDLTDLNLRNWIIYRDYLNVLEYVREAFSHFLTKS